MNKSTIKKFVNGCDITLVFSQSENPKLKNNVLWYLTQCYEDRINQEICSLLKNEKANIINKKNAQLI